MKRESRPGRRLTRREALKVLGIGSAGSLAASALRARRLPAGPSRRADVVVVGAGLAGLAAARRLVAAGRKVVLLEARDRVGGRVKSGTIAGRPVDLGGMWVGRHQPRLLDLLRRYGIPTAPQFVRGRCITEIGGRRYTGEGEEAPLDPADETEWRRLVKKLDALATRVPVEAPWTAREAAEWDRVTFDEWTRANAKSPAVRAMTAIVSRGLFCTEPEEISLIFVLFSLRTGEGFQEVWGMQEGAQAFLVPGGLHRLAREMARELGDAIAPNAPVAAIAQDASGVTVTEPGGSWRAAAAIVAVPLPLSARIRYEPPLPAGRDALAQRCPMASVIKYWIAYREPFWRKRGWNALVETDEPPTSEFADASPAGDGPGLIVGFVESRSARDWTLQPLETRKRRIAEKIAHFLGPEGADPVDYVENDWPSEPWTRGCFGATMGPGVLTSLGPWLRRPFGRIHWAGAETSALWSGYVEGAILSGERAAAEALERPA